MEGFRDGGVEGCTCWCGRVGVWGRTMKRMEHTCTCTCGDDV